MLSSSAACNRTCERRSRQRQGRAHKADPAAGQPRLHARRRRAGRSIRARRGAQERSGAETEQRVPIQPSRTISASRCFSDKLAASASAVARGACCRWPANAAAACSAAAALRPRDAGGGGSASGELGGAAHNCLARSGGNCAAPRAARAAAAAKRRIARRAACFCGAAASFQARAAQARPQLPLGRQCAVMRLYRRRNGGRDSTAAFSADQNKTTPPCLRGAWRGFYPAPESGRRRLRRRAVGHPSALARLLSQARVTLTLMLATPPRAAGPRTRATVPPPGGAAQRSVAESGVEQPPAWSLGPGLGRLAGVRRGNGQRLCAPAACHRLPSPAARRALPGRPKAACAPSPNVALSHPSG